MTKSTYAVDKDASGKRFIYEVGGEATKNHGIEDQQNDTNGEGRIYETGGIKCPVHAFELYLSKLHPHINDLWQRPRMIKSYENEDVWYCAVPHGENHIGKMMAIMSTKYGLSKKYTNHSAGNECPSDGRR